jgi:hypothetical protein
MVESRRREHVNSGTYKRIKSMLLLLIIIVMLAGGRLDAQIVTNGHVNYPYTGANTPAHGSLTGRPPLQGDRLIGQLAAGAAGGILCGYLGSTVGGMGIVIGYNVGTALGVYTIGSIGDQTGSFSWTLFGSTIGFFGGLFIQLYTIGHLEDTGFPYIWGIASIASPTIAFNITRRYKSDTREPGGSLVTVSNGSFRVSKPVLKYTGKFPNGVSKYAVSLIQIDI